MILAELPLVTASSSKTTGVDGAGPAVSSSPGFPVRGALSSPASAAALVLAMTLSLRLSMRSLALAALRLASTSAPSSIAAV